MGKKVSRNRKGRILRRFKDDDKLVKLRNAIRNARRKNNFDKVKKSEIELVKINMLIILMNYNLK